MFEMSSNRTPPSSPRAPKIQQQSWDVCNSPVVDIFDPVLQMSPRNPNSPRTLDGQKNSSCFEYRTTSRQNQGREQNKQLHDNSPRSPQILTTFANTNDNSNSSFIYPTSPSSRSPKSPRKFIFDPISPTYTQQGEKFKYFEPITSGNDEKQEMKRFVSSSSSFRHQLPNKPKQNIQKGQISEIFKQKVTGIKSPSASDYGSKEFWNRQFEDSDRIYQSNKQQNLDKNSGSCFNMKRDSCITESTQLSGDTYETNETSLITTTTVLSPSVATCNYEQSITEFKINENNDYNKVKMKAEKIQCRRNAINITSNPGYQAIHSSHNTLDRSCSDSIVSLHYRKSTSDLVNEPEDTPLSMVKPKHRSSSKSGLAYLASRRSSRDSAISGYSNTSIFSNDEIGPLAFQASPRGQQRRTSQFLEIPVPDHIRPRVCSLPDRAYNPRLSDDIYRLRHFSINKGYVVNCGDSIISRRSRSNTSVNSSISRASERSPFEGSCCGTLPPSPTDLGPIPPSRYRIVMLGESGVGKTALVSQFMTSEYMHTYDASLDDEFGEKTVCVLLDDQESELVFIDHPSIEMSVENSLTTYEPHACAVIYSVVDRNSFQQAEEIINYLWRENITKEKTVILVGNKVDLARSRLITTAEGKSLAASKDAKFIETSSGIQHNVDELLVGILKQIRLKEKREKKTGSSASKMKTSRTHISLHLAKEILQKICLNDISKSKSCENLHVL